MVCLWCGAQLSGQQRKYCSHSHRQMGWARNNYPYRRKQYYYKRARRGNNAWLNKNLAFIVSAMMIYGEIEQPPTLKN